MLRNGLIVLGWLVVAITLVGLVSGAAWLEHETLGTGLPLGTLAAAACLVLLPALAVPVLRPGPLRRFAILLAGCGALWLPVSAWLAGNLRLNFTAAPAWWWPVTLLLPGLAVLLWLFIGAFAAWRRWRPLDSGPG